VSAKICISILPKNTKQALTLIGKAEKAGADLIEVRIDRMEESRTLKDLSKSTKRPLIATNKLTIEHGYFAGTENERLQTLLVAAKSGFQYVDIDILGPKSSEAIAKLKETNAKLIVSYHKFDGILNSSALECILNEEISSGADICKIVLTAKQIEDNLLILNFISIASAKAKLVCFCMGEVGKISRLLSPAFGAYFTFAFLDGGKETAAGQLSIKDMRSAYKILGIKQ
jgi:3-dehydroquinate dehydratase type I